MGWTVEVHEVTFLQATCHESIPVWPLPPGTAGPEQRVCGWTGTLTGNDDVAVEEAAAHRLRHIEGWDAYNDGVDKYNEKMGRTNHGPYDC